MSSDQIYKEAVYLECLSKLVFENELDKKC